MGMHQVWEGESPQARFWSRLLNSRVDLPVNSQDWLKSLRYRHDEVKWWNRRCGHIFEERGINLYQLIAQSHGECWDDEDEQKCAHAVAENVAPPMLKEKPRQTCLPPGSPMLSPCTPLEKRKTPVTPTASNEGRKKNLQAQ